MHGIGHEMSDNWIGFNKCRLICNPLHCSGAVAHFCEIDGECAYQASKRLFVDQTFKTTIFSHIH